MIALYLQRQTCSVYYNLADDFEDEDILKVIWALDINKAHGHDNILTCITNCETHTMITNGKTIVSDSR